MYITIFTIELEAKSITSFFQQIYSNQPTFFDKTVKKAEAEKICIENREKEKKVRELIKQLTIIAKTNSITKEAIINEMVLHSNEQGLTHFENIKEWNYRMDLLNCLRNASAQAFLEFANEILKRGIYIDMHNIIPKLGRKWLSDELSTEEIKPIIIACAEKKYESAAKVMLGISQYGNSVRNLDKTLGEKYVHEWINETTNNNKKLHYYRLLRKAGIECQEQEDILKLYIENTNIPISFRLKYVKELEKIGGTNQPNIREAIRKIKIEKEEKLKQIKVQQKKQKILMENYNMTNVLEFYDIQLEFIKENNIVSVEDFSNQLSEFKDGKNITNLVDIITLENQEKFMRSPYFKTFMKNNNLTSITDFIKEQKKLLKEHPNPFKEIEKAKKF